jgi:gliding motility-associated-like protein
MKRLALATLVMMASMLGLQQKAQATHIMGMNISYEHIVADTYVVTLDFWRYCGGSAFNGTPTSASTGVPTSYQIMCPDVQTSVYRTAQFDTLIDVSPICAPMAPFQNSCVAGWQTGLLGIEWTIMRDTLVLSELTQTTCSEFILMYASGARNTGVNYVSQPSIAAWTTLKEEDYPNNSSPLFTTSKPIPFFCDGQDVTYNWGIVEQDGDSLYWELDTAMQSFNFTTGFSPITYVAPWYGLEPMTGVIIDPATGQLEFTAYKPAGAIAANYAVAVKVTEYDPESGERISVTQRDVQFIVIDSCDNLAPQQDTNGVLNLTGSGAQVGPQTIEVCVGQNFAFDVAIFDLDTAGNYSNDSLTITCNISQVLPGATWSSLGTNPDTVHIEWNAVPVAQTFVPFNITVEDDFCPVTGFNIFNYNIRIVPTTYLGPDTAICNLDTITLDAHGGDTFYWSVLYGDPIIVGQNFGCVQCQEPWIHPQQTTAYVVTSNLSATCGNTDTIVIEVFDQFNVSFGPIHGGTVDTVVYCATDALDTLMPYTPGGTFLGPGIVNTVNGVFAPDILDPGFGKDSTVTITYILEGVCANTSQRVIRVKGLPDARVLTEGPFCKFSTSEQLVGYTSGGTWSGPNTTTTGVFNPSAYASTAPDTVLIYHTVDDSGCVFTDSAYFRVIDEYNSAIDSLPKICAGEEVLIHLNNYEGDPFGEWTGKNVEEDPNNPGQYYFNTAGLKAGKYAITYSIDGQCGTSTTEELVINLLPDASIFGADSVYCDNIKDSVLLSTARPDGIWGGSMVELHDGYFIPSQLGEGLYTISYELYDTVTTCYNKEVVEVRIARTPAKPTVHGGGPYCQGEGWWVRGDGLLSNTYKWYVWKGTYSHPDSIIQWEDLEVIGAGNPFYYGELVDMPTVIYGTQVSEYGCESYFKRLEVEVRPSPNAFFRADSTDVDVTIAADDAVTGTVPFEVKFLNMSGPDTSKLTFTWEFDQYSTYNEETGADQTWIFEEIGTYFVTLVADNGRCIDSHTVKIRTDRITNFYIPNVFTPNGDNNNDLFTWKIEGIEDFNIKIFNRWGTKVFETSDMTQFWDGGKEPDGTYYYVVTGRERTLDAEEIEFRGDLTLIRSK